MINKILLKETIISQKNAFLDKRDLFRRSLIEEVIQKYSKLKEVLIITGLRRAGKSSLMRLIWHELKQEKNLSDNQFLYLNFEDERLSGFKKEHFSQVLEAYYELDSPNTNQPIFLFLDEIQNVKYWEKWVTRLYEENRFKIFITGSNATLLSSELATALTGRNIPITLYPLSFFEFYCYFQKNTLGEKNFYIVEKKAKIKKSFHEYFQFGGMPEYLKTKSSELIQEYFKDIIMRDIVNRYNVKYKQGLRELAHLVLANPGQIYSLRNLSKSIEIKNINTVKNYLGYLEDSFLFFRIPLFSYSYKQQIYNPDKIYLSDLAFFHQIAFKTSDNIGSLYENIVFLALKYGTGEVFYYKTKNNLEVDFVVKKKNNITDLIQVCLSLQNLKTKEREIKALTVAMEELNLNHGLILTDDEEDTITIEDKKIQVTPIYKWLLEK